MVLIQPPRTLYHNHPRHYEIQEASFLIDSPIKHDWNSVTDNETGAPCPSTIERKTENEGAIQLTILQTKYNERIRYQLRRLQQIQPQMNLTDSRSCQIEKQDADKLIAFRAEFNQRLRQQLTRLREERDRASEARQNEAPQYPL